MTGGLTCRHVEEASLMLLQVLLVVLVLVVVLGRGQQAGNVADAFGDALPEEQLGAQTQVLGVFDEAEADHGALAGAQLVLRHGQRRGYAHRRPQDGAGSSSTHLPVKALHRGRLPDVAHVHGHLRAPAEGLGVKEQDDGSLKLAADGRVHLGADHHHTLKQPIRRRTQTSYDIMVMPK